jgi:hypothetical protein
LYTNENVSLVSCLEWNLLLVLSKESVAGIKQSKTKWTQGKGRNNKGIPLGAIYSPSPSLLSLNKTSLAIKQEQARLSL